MSEDVAGKAALRIVNALITLLDDPKAVRLRTDASVREHIEGALRSAAKDREEADLSLAIKIITDG